MTDHPVMPLALVGCDFRIASSRLRSRLVLSADEALEISKALKEGGAADGFVDLTTCNRTEWLVSSSNPAWAAELLRAKMLARLGAEREGLHPYTYVEDEAARHVLRVAVGRESLVVGERQIAGQLFRALEAARTRGSASRSLNGLGSVAGRLVRLALSRGCLESGSCGVHSLALSYLRQQRPGDGRLRVAAVGLGAIGRRVLGLLEDDPRIEPLPCNRTICTCERPQVRPLTDLAELLADADAAIVCTGAPKPVLRAEHLRPRAAERPLLLIDLGIPHQIDRSIAAEGVTIVGLDDLVAFHNGGIDETPEDHTTVDALVDQALVELRAFCNERFFSDILDTVQRHHRQLVREDIPRILDGRLSYLPKPAREQLEHDLRHIVLEYTNEIFRTIRETSERRGNGTAEDEIAL